MFIQRLMKHLFVSLVAAVMLSACASPSGGGQSASSKPTSSASSHQPRLIIFYSTDHSDSKTQLIATIKDYGASLIYVLDTMHALVIAIPEGKTVSEAKAFFKEDKNVLLVNEDQQMSLQ